MSRNSGHSTNNPTPAQNRSKSRLPRGIGGRSAMGGAMVLTGERPRGGIGNEPQPVSRSNWRRSRRSEEHTSELQSRSDLVCRLLLEKKKKEQKNSSSTPR